MLQYVRAVDGVLMIRTAHAIDQNLWLEYMQRTESR